MNEARRALVFAEARSWLMQRGPCDYGVMTGCAGGGVCQGRDPRYLISSLVELLEEFGYKIYEPDVIVPNIDVRTE